jgi:hypothetical protein
LCHDGFFAKIGEKYTLEKGEAWREARGHALKPVTFLFIGNFLMGRYNKTDLKLTCFGESRQPLKGDFANPSQLVIFDVSNVW